MESADNIVMYYTKPELNYRRRRSLAQQDQAKHSRRLFVKWGITLRVYVAFSLCLIVIVVHLHFQYQNFNSAEGVSAHIHNDEPKAEIERRLEQSNSSSFRRTGHLDERVLVTSSLFGIDRVDRSKRLEFVHITKTGGSAIEMGAATSGIQWGACHYVEIPYLGCNHTADWEFPIGVRMPEELKNKTHSEPWHSPPHWLIPNPHPKDRVADFLVVRDPYQRIFSEFYCSAFGYNGTVNPKSLNAWIVGKLTEETPYYGHLLPQYYYVFHHKTGAQIVDHVLRYEALAQEFKLLMKLYDLKIQIPPKKESHFVMSIEQSASRLTVADLTVDTLRVINKHYRRDFERFGYEMIASD